MARFSSAERIGQSRISSIWRAQPMQVSSLGSVWQIDTQGEGTEVSSTRRARARRRARRASRASRSAAGEGRSGSCEAVGAQGAAGLFWSFTIDP